MTTAHLNIAIQTAPAGGQFSVRADVATMNLIDPRGDS